MLNFCHLWNHIDGEPIPQFPPPVSYNLPTLDISSNSLNNVEGESSYALKPLSQEDMCRYAADDVVANYAAMHKGKNPATLGKPMTDEELRRFFGQNW